MVTKVTRDVMDLSVRAIADGITVEGNCGANFSFNGVPIGLSTPCDGAFVNLDATNITATGTFDVTGATVVGIVSVPIGGVIFFNAAFATIPSNWQLCDGTNGTPDMTNQFVYGTNTEGELLDTGGDADAVVVDHGHSLSGNGSHSHTTRAGVNGNGSGGFDDANHGFNVAVDGNGSHSHTINNTGVSGNNANLPPYIKLAFIQRMS